MFSRFAERAAVITLLAAGTSVLEGAPHEGILGVWRGTSICVKNPDYPACHDEVVVYEFRDSKAGGGAVTLSAFKIVDGEKGLMYEADFTYDPEQRAWVSEFHLPRSHGLWTYFVRGDGLSGTLVDLPAKHLVRNISARRESGR